MKYISIVTASAVALTLISASFGPSNAKSRSEAYDIGYEMAAFFLCPNVYKYSTMKDFFKYDKTIEYNRGFASLRAALKGPHPSKVCFDAARASSWFTVR